MEENMEVYEEEEEEVSSAEMAERILTQIYKEMEKVSKTSQEYMVLCQRATDLTEQCRNIKEAIRSEADIEEKKRNRWVPYFQIAGNIIGGAVGSGVSQWLNRKTVNDVLDTEKDGYMITSRSTGFIQKPRS